MASGIENFVEHTFAPFADKQQMGGLMQRAGFALPVVDSDTVTVTSDNMFKLLADLRGMGESNAVNARARISRAIMCRSCLVHINDMR